LTEQAGALLVPVVSLDTIDLAPADLIKMDIEGGESQALAGARTLLTRHRPIVLVALHGPEHERFCPAFLRSLGYRVFDIDGSPVAGRAPGDEIYAL
jgi:hypothetical protein